MKPLVSVIIPIYNVEEYLSECINSIISQTYRNIEIILVDDGSPDASGSICDEYALKDERIRVVHKKNGGLSSARNAGLEIANGQYITFVDSDDWVAPTFLDEHVSQILEYCGDISFGGKILYTSHEIQEELCPIRNEVVGPEEIVSRMIYDREIGVSAWGKVYKKELFDEIRFPEGEIHEDVAIIYTVIAKCTKVCVISKALYYYRNNPGGISKQFYSHKYDVVFFHDISNELFVEEFFPGVIDFTKAATATSCFDMVMKIAKTPHGISEFDKELNKYKSEFRKRYWYFREYFNPTKKNYLWIFGIRERSNILLRLFGLLYRIRG